MSMAPEAYQKVMKHLKHAEVSIVSCMETENLADPLSALHECKVQIWKAMDSLAKAAEGRDPS